MTNKVIWKGSAQGRMYTIDKNTIPAGDFLSRESDNNEKTSLDDRDHFFYFRWLSIDNEKRGGDETSPNRPCHYVETDWREILEMCESDSSHVLFNSTQRLNFAG